MKKIIDFFRWPFWRYQCAKALCSYFNDDDFSWGLAVAKEHHDWFVDGWSAWDSAAEEWDCACEYAR